MNSLQLFAPAKVNLFLAITGRRPDGFHNLLSLVGPVEFGDDLQIELRDDGDFSLDCDAPGVPTDETNLVLRAARLFRERVGQGRGAHFRLIKRIPAGAGLGGGSSDGTAALRGLNQLAGSPLDTKGLTELAARLGSDCVLFLNDAPSVIRGRGELIDVVEPGVRSRLSGQRLLLFKPDLGINTAWAYKEMARSADAYLAPDQAEKKLTSWLEGPASAAGLVFNNMETVAFQKFLALPTLLATLRTEFGLTVGMSGSGSCCFALLEENHPVEAIKRRIHESWGGTAFVVETRMR